MDLAGGVYSYTAYDIIWSVVLAVNNNEGSDNDEDPTCAKRTGLCLMPSALELKGAAKFVEKAGQTLIPLIHQPEAASGKYELTLKSLISPFLYTVLNVLLLIPSTVPSSQKESLIPVPESRSSIRRLLIP
jgi:hypothetical protein